MERPDPAFVSISQVSAFIDTIAGDNLHKRSLLTLARAALGVIHGASLRVHDIGRGMAAALDKDSRHAIKEVDRFLSGGIVPAEFTRWWVPFIVAGRAEIVVALDWTDFDDDDQAVIALHGITSHGRATPLTWKTVRKSELKNSRNAHEDEVLQRFRDALPAGVKVTVLADRGFEDTHLFEFINALGLDYAIRVRGTVVVEDSSGESRAAKDWLNGSTRPKTLRDARITRGRYPLATFVAVRAKGMKDAWYLASSSGERGAADIIKLYGRRFTIEEAFRDTKNALYGMGLSAARVARTDRRDRLLLLAALAVAFLTLLGAAGESIDLEKRFKANTVKTRTYSLFRQGCMYYPFIVKPHWKYTEPLLLAFGEQLAAHKALTDVLGTL